MQRAAFLSDAHLGSSDPSHERKKEEMLLGFFEYALDHFNMVCICGDMFDCWFEYHHAVINRYFTILVKFAQLVEAGVEVHYVAGNHDFWMLNFLPEQVGVTVHKVDFTTTIAGLKVYVKHGDGIYKNDRGYRVMKRVLQNKLAIQGYRFLHPDLGVPIAQFFSNLSRERSTNKEFKGGEDYRAYAERVLQSGYDVVVLAHTHQPHLEWLENGQYLNPGDWISHFSYGTIDEEGVHLHLWSQ